MRLAGLCFLAALGGARPALAEAPGSRSKPVESQVRALLPKGWSLETEGLPEGVLGLFAGPSNASGQATVTVALLDSGAPSLLEERDRHALAERMASAGGSDASVRAEGPLGGPSIESRVDGLVVRQLVVPGRISYLVTIVAPEALYLPVLKEVRAMADSLAKAAVAKDSKPKASRAGLYIEPVLRPDEAPDPGREVRQAD